MKVEIIYDSQTGRTAQAAAAMGKIFEEHGHVCRVQSVMQADPVDVAQADLICVGTWVKGLFIILQHPNEHSMAFIDKLEGLAGKQVVAFCTYLLAAGSTLPQMAKSLEGKGGTVVGQFKYRSSEPNSQFLSFVKSLT